MLWEKTTRLLDKKFWGVGREEIPLKSTVEMWPGSACTCPGVPEGSNCCGDLPNISLDYLVSLSRSRTSGISGLSSFLFCGLSACSSESDDFCPTVFKM